MISIMIQISIMIMLMIMAVIFNKLIHAIHEFENFLLWLWKLCFCLIAMVRFFHGLKIDTDLTDID